MSDVATTYFQLLDLDQELEIQRAATNAYAGSYRIFNDRLINGVASKLETDRAAAALANAAAAHPATWNSRSRPRRTSSTSCWAATRARCRAVPCPINRRRRRRFRRDCPAPCSAAGRTCSPSEQSLIAANANIGVSVANFFPQIGLTTFLGRASPELSSFTGGAGNLWNVGGTLTGPLFQGGQLRAQYRVSKAQFEEAKAAYQQTRVDGVRGRV